MNKFRLYFILLFISIALFSCNKDDDNLAQEVPPRDFAEQYLKDNDSIEKYLKTHYLKQIVVDGYPDIEINAIPNPNPTGLVSIWDNTEIPLQSKIVKDDDRTSNLVSGRVADPVDYKMYYLIINPGGGVKPTTIDSTYTSYKGFRLDNEVFDSNDVPIWSTFPALSQFESVLISGFRQFLPELRTATAASTNPDGTINFTDSGIGVVFIPSGIAYFADSRPNIPAYSPIAFRIRLHTIKNRDHDRDGVKSNTEDLDGNGDPYNDDTDGDTIPDFLDVDDDGDNFLTIGEIKVNGVITFPYPTCTSGKSKYLDKTCK